MGITSKLSVRFDAQEVGSNDFGGPSYQPRIEHILQLASGVAAAQADILWVDERTVAGGANDDIDLSGVLQSAFGVTLAMVEIVALAVVNAPIKGPANVGVLSIGGAASPVARYTAARSIGGPGAFLFECNPDATGLGAVVAATGDQLRIANAGGTPNVYQIGILARTA